MTASEVAAELERWADQAKQIDGKVQIPWRAAFVIADMLRDAGGHRADDLMEQLDEHVARVAGMTADMEMLLQQHGATPPPAYLDARDVARPRQNGASAELSAIVARWRKEGEAKQ
jgi:protein involved in polysaccharide export with SLBB domain